MLLNETKLTYDIVPFEQRKYNYIKFQKNKYYCFDGFAKDNAVCLELIPSIIRKDFPY